MNKQIERQIQKMVSKEALKSFWINYSAKHNVSNNRERSNIIHKHSFAHIARNNTNVSLQGIADVLGKNHATVLHACKKHEINYRYDPDYRAAYDIMFADIEDFLLVNGIVPKTIHQESQEVEDIHFKMVNVSRRLRNKIKELDKYKKEVEAKVKRAEHIKKHNMDLQKRVNELEMLALRYKNLL